MIDCNIGIQVRLSSTRLPKKCFLPINSESIISNLLTHTSYAINTLKRQEYRYCIQAKIFILFPENEKDIWDDFIKQWNANHAVKIEGIGGSLENVFSRYEEMQKNGADYLVRLTGDCPILPEQIIIKAITTGIRHRLDYISNVDPLYRTAPDGFDIEVISARSFDWLVKNSDNMTYSDREHVTTYLRNNFAKWMRVAIITHPLDCSDLKYSVDTKDEYEVVKKRFEEKKRKDSLAAMKGWGIYEY